MTERVNQHLTEFRTSSSSAPSSIPYPFPFPGPIPLQAKRIIEAMSMRQWVKKLCLMKSHVDRRIKTSCVGSIRIRLMVMPGKWPQFNRNNNLHFEFNNLHSGNQTYIGLSIKHSKKFRPLYLSAFSFFFFWLGGTMTQYHFFRFRPRPNNTN